MIVLFELNLVNVYRRVSFLPNVNPRCPQPPDPIVFKNHVGLFEYESGSKLNNYCPEQVFDDEEPFIFEST
jgi:hypothetical protein